MPILEASPHKSTAEALATLRKTLRLACRCYMERVEMEIIRIHEQVVTAGMSAANGEKKKTAPVGGKSKVALADGNGSGSPARRAGTGASTASPNSVIHDLRDMLTLLRTLDVKPEVGRRKELKKIESLVEDLRLLSERWG